MIWCDNGEMEHASEVHCFHGPYLPWASKMADCDASGASPPPWRRHKWPRRLRNTRYICRERIVSTWKLRQIFPDTQAVSQDREKMRACRHSVRVLTHRLIQQLLSWVLLGMWEGDRDRPPRYYTTPHRQNRVPKQKIQNINAYRNFWYTPLTLRQIHDCLHPSQP